MPRATPKAGLRRGPLRSRMLEPNTRKAARRRIAARACLALIAAGLAGGCGQKGPLRLPEPLPAPAPAAQPGPPASAPEATRAATPASAAR